MDIVIRPARATDCATVGELTVTAYLDAGFISPEDPYVAHLRDAEDRARQAELLVAADAENDQPLGSVTWSMAEGTYAEQARPGEAEFRMLAVGAAARGRGAGEALVRACLERSRANSCTGLLLSTQPEMVSAHRIYRRLGFARLPERDWSPVPGVTLMVFRHSL